MLKSKVEFFLHFFESLKQLKTGLNEGNKNMIADEDLILLFSSRM